VGIGVRGPDGRSDDADAFGLKDLVERGRELAVSIPDEKAHLMPASWKPMARLRACWVTQGLSGCLVAVVMWTRLLDSSMKKST
jgi:hypothetical protein